MKMGEKIEPYERVAKIVVEEINSIDRIQSMLELGETLLQGLPEPEVAQFGVACGDDCNDAWGVGCGNGCISPGGKQLTEELIKDRYAIDVFGKKGIKSEEMIAVQKDFGKFHEVVTAEITKKLRSKRYDR